MVTVIHLGSARLLFAAIYTGAGKVEDELSLKLCHSKVGQAKVSVKLINYKKQRTSALRILFKLCKIKKIIPCSRILKCNVYA